MIRRPLAAASCALAALVFTAAASHAGINVDGDLTEWGVTNSSLSSWTIPGSTGAPSHLPVFGTSAGGTGGFSFAYMREDLNDTINDSGPLGPNAGGQKYDAEFLGVGVDGSNLVIAIATGQRRDNGLTRFSPGDIRITTSQGVFGIEVGGGAGGASGTSVVGNVAGSGSTYSLNSSGFTVTGGHTASTAGAVGVEHRAGSMWKTVDTDWIPDPIVGGTPPKNGAELVQLKFGAGTYAGTANYIYRFDAVLGTHAVIELSIALSSFGNAIINGVQWAPSCGNDFVYIENLAIPTPEPATLAMGFLGAIGIAGLRRFRRTAA